MTAPVSGCSEKQLFQKIASLIDDLNCYPGRELLRITAILEPIVKTYKECL